MRSCAERSTEWCIIAYNKIFNKFRLLWETEVATGHILNPPLYVLVVCSVRMFRYFVHMHFEFPAHFIIIDCIAVTIFILKHRLRMLDTLKN
jgi:hypothetical protein